MSVLPRIAGNPLRRSVLLLAALLASGGCGVKHMIYPAPPVSVPSPPPEPIREVQLDSATGETIIAWRVDSPHAEPATPVVLFFHGNGENLETMRFSGFFERVSDLGFHCLAVDYPGYGRSSGSPSERSNLAAAEAAFEYVGEEFPNRPHAVSGWSLGAAVAIQLAASHPDGVAGLAALSSWTSLADTARLHFPGFLVNVLLSERYDSLAAVDRIQAPTLLIHGTSDNIIPVGHGEQLAAAFGDRARWVPVVGAGHNDLLARTETWRELAAFLGSL